MSKQKLIEKNTELLNEVYGANGLLDSLKPLLNLSNEGYDGLVGATEIIYGVMTVIGVSMVVIYFMMSLIDSMERDNMTLEFVIRKVMELVVASCLVAFGYDLSIKFLNLGDALLEDIEAALEEAGTAGSSSVLSTKIAELQSMTKKELRDLKWELMIPSWGQKVGIVTASIAAYSRAIEFFVRLMGLPVAIPNVFQEGARSPGIRYLKKLAAVALQRFVIFAILYVSSLLMAAMMDGSSTKGAGMFAPLLITYTQITLIFKSQNFANDLLGV